MPTIDNYIRINPLDLNKNVAIGVAFPFNADAVFNQTFTQKEQVKSNLINVLLTEPGERVNLPDFGVGLRRFLFENMDGDVLAELVARIKQQTGVYIPTIQLQAVDFITSDEDSSLAPNQVTVSITYNIMPVNAQDQLNITSTMTS